MWLAAHGRALIARAKHEFAFGEKSLDVRTFRFVPRIGALKGFAVLI